MLVFAVVVTRVPGCHCQLAVFVVGGWVWNLLYTVPMTRLRQSSSTVEDWPVFHRYSPHPQRQHTLDLERYVTAGGSFHDRLGCKTISALNQPDQQPYWVESRAQCRWAAVISLFPRSIDWCRRKIHTTLVESSLGAAAAAFVHG